MIVILLMGCSAAALKAPNDLWASSLFSLAVAMIPVALLRSLTAHGSARSAWGAWTILSGSYLLLTFGPWFSTEVKPFLLSSMALDWLYPKIHNPSLLSFTFARPMLHLIGGSSSGYTIESQENFMHFRGGALLINFYRIGHSLVALLIGTVAYGWFRAGESAVAE
jgi:hypothetical protein